MTDEKGTLIAPVRREGRIGQSWPSSRPERRRWRKNQACGNFGRGSRQRVFQLVAVRLRGTRCDRVSDLGQIIDDGMAWRRGLKDRYPLGGDFLTEFAGVVSSWPQMRRPEVITYSLAGTSHCLCLRDGATQPELLSIGRTSAILHTGAVSAFDAT